MCGLRASRSSLQRRGLRIPHPVARSASQRRRPPVEAEEEEAGAVEAEDGAVVAVARALEAVAKEAAKEAGAASSVGRPTTGRGSAPRAVVVEAVSGKGHRL